MNTNLCYDGRKSFITWQIQRRHFGGACPPFWLTKNTYLEHHVTTRKPTMMQKAKVTFSPTYLTKVTYINSKLKFLNTERLVVQVSKTRFNTQSLPL